MPIIYLLFAILITGILTSIDGMAALIPMVLTLFFGTIISVFNKEGYRSKGMKLFLMVYSIYIVIAYIFSLSFLNGEYFAVSDPSRYIENYMYSTTFLFDVDYIKSCYFGLADNNALYNSFLNVVAMFANNYVFGGATVFYMTLWQTLFGVLFICILYRILALYYDSNKSFSYALVFSLCSQILFYSSVIIRDIIIVFFFSCIVYLILKPFKFSNLLILFILMFLTWGIRLYSGLFCIIFIFLYLYLLIQNTKYKVLALPLFFISLLFIGIFSYGSVIVEQSLDEITSYSEMTLETETEKGGLFTFFYRLPHGIREIAILFFSQMAPFPPFLGFTKIQNFSNLVMKLPSLVYGLWWFFVFYTLIYSFVKSKSYNCFTIKEKLLFIVAIFFILANTAHPDYRRMLPVYIITYLLYLKVINYLPKAKIKLMRHNLAFIYGGLIFSYFLIKGI